MFGRSSQYGSRTLLLRVFGGVVAIALAQCVSIGFLASAQRDGGHVVQATEEQITRVERIALLAMTAHDGRPVAHWRSELVTTVADVRRVGRDLMPRRDLQTTPRGPDGLTSLARGVIHFCDAALRLARDPRDAAAYEYVASHRQAVSRQIEMALHVRERRFETIGAWLVGAIVAGLLAQIAGFAFVWLRVLLPTIEKADQNVRKLAESRGRFFSIFSQNPDLIGIYDLEGRVVRGNRSSADVFGVDKDWVGRPLWDILAEDEVERTKEAFEAAKAGRMVAIETAVISASGERVPLMANVFPQFVGSQIVGVITVGRDVRGLKVVEANLREQRERIAELYELSATSGFSWQEQIDRTMKAAVRRLNFDFGVLSEIRGDLLATVATSGRSGIGVGDADLVERTLSRYAIESGALWSVDDLPASAFRDDPSGRGRRWGAVAVVPLEIEGRAYGALIVGSRTARTIPLSEGDRHYMSLVALLLGAAVERSRQQRELDALAFYDQLTGLPNRTALNKELDSVLTRDGAERSDFAVHYVDLDLFKRVNDGHGHAAGDAVLKAAAARMQACVRDGDVVARVGGDEFVIVQRLEHGRSEAEALAQRLIAKISEPFAIDGVSFALGASIGIEVVAGEDAFDAKAGLSAILARADEALYDAKRAGRNRYQVANSESRLDSICA